MNIKGQTDTVSTASPVKTQRSESMSAEGTGAGAGTGAEVFTDSGHPEKRAVPGNFPLLYGA